MSGHRREQLGEVIMNEISMVILKELKDPRIGFASVTRVQVTPDSRTAHIYVSVMGTKEEQEATLKALRHATGFLRHELAQRIVTRHIPALIFHFDDSIERGARVLELLEKAKQRESGEGLVSRDILPGEKREL